MCDAAVYSVRLGVRADGATSKHLPGTGGHRYFSHQLQQYIRAAYWVCDPIRCHNALLEDYETLVVKPFNASEIPS